MDNYTKAAKNWLDRDHRRTDEKGIYIALQPIYGLREGCSMPGVTKNYCITYQIMRALNNLEFESLLDVGGLEGYKAALARSLFHVRIRNCDLSINSCKRAREIYSIDSEQVDIHQLPYPDDAFDVCLCSETLEHVTDIEQATGELIRVSKKAVVITVPHEPAEVVERNIRENIIHGHIHSLDTGSFNFAFPRVNRIITRKMLCPLLKIPRAIVDAREVDVEAVRNTQGYSSVLLKMYNLLAPVFRWALNKRAVALLVHLDDFISNLLPLYGGIVFVLLKDPGCYQYRRKTFTIPQILEFKVPYHYL